MSDTELWARRLERERRARKEAETLLESKSHELYLANKALQQSYDAIAAAKNYTENILRSLMNALMVVTPDGTIQAVNVAACSLLGYSENLGHGPSHKLCFAVPQEATRRNVNSLDGAVWCHDNEGVHERTENVLRIIFGSGNGVVGLL